MLLSLDISTSCIGYAIFQNDGSIKELSCVKFRDGINLFEKLLEFKEKTKYFKLLSIDRVAIEEPVKKFEGKFSNADTISKLNFFNGMISSHIFQELGVIPVYHNVKTARASVFPGIQSKNEKGTIKHMIWERVMQMEPKINWVYNKNGKLKDENYDMADAYVVGVSQLILEIEQKNKKEELPQKKEITKTVVKKKSLTKK